MIYQYHILTGVHVHFGVDMYSEYGHRHFKVSIKGVDYGCPLGLIGKTV